MRVLITLVMLLFVTSLALAAGATVPTVAKPGFCWGGGIIPTPPDFCWGGGIIIIPFIVVDPTDGELGGFITDWTEFTATGGTGQGGGDTTGTGSTEPAAVTPAQPAPAPTRAPASQMYIPPAVWEWVAAHPVRTR